MANHGQIAKERKDVEIEESERQAKVAAKWHRATN